MAHQYFMSNDVTEGLVHSIDGGHEIGLSVHGTDR